jgi:hypothetical protein
VAGGDGRGALGLHFPGWAVASQCSVQVCAVRGFLEGRECPVARRRTRRSSSHISAQVFDRGGGAVTGEREGVSAPVGCWGGVEFACVNESDGE